jgi:hexosaminidase
MKTHKNWALGFFLLILLFTFVDGREQPRILDLMPYPAKVIQKKGKMRLTDSFMVEILNASGDRLGRAASRMLRRLSGRTGLFFPQDYVIPGEKVEGKGLKLDFKRVGKLEVKEDETYRLAVGLLETEITGETDIGVMRGLETFLQLVSVDKEGYYIPVVNIEDIPRFPWRGLLIDSGRHFLPVEIIKRNLDGISAVKMNVLHWHLSEDQGFRVECMTFPKLHQLGSDGFYYTQEQIRDVIAYAADRGIRVMPEFDIPGHSTSWLVGYSELASAPGPYTIERGWGVKDPTFNPTIEETYEFFDKFFKEMSGLFPDAYMHIGGDENNGKQWDSNPDIQKFKEENNLPDNHALQAYFNKRILKILTKYGKKMIGWDEIFQHELPKSIVIHSWRGHKAMNESAKKGYRSILSNSYYIDLCQTTEFHYLNDPIPEDSPLTDKEKQNILGGEATMWGEIISPETVDSRIWPRTAAIAERLWSPSQIKDVQDMYKRMEVISIQLEELGLTHKKNQDMMLRRLLRSDDTKALKTLVDVLEPLKGYNRHGQGITYTSASPLTRVVDAALPDARVAREFRKKVDLFLKKKKEKDVEILKKHLILWQKNHKYLKPQIDRSPVLKEIEPLSQELSTTAAIGLQSLEFILIDKKPGENWIEEKLKVLEEAKKPKGHAELMIVSAIEKLVRAAF